MEIKTTPETIANNVDLIGHIAKFQFTEIGNNKSYISILVLIVAGIFFMHDIYVDFFLENKGFSHVLIESCMFIAVLLALALEVKRVLRLVSTVSVSQDEIERLKRHLHEAITDEFARWKLTKTEQEIALFLIKGLSMQEIADLRNVKEKSVRQQATGIYSKANIANRYELTSHFIEDLLSPATMPT